MEREGSEPRYVEAVKPGPETTVARFASTAARSGYDGIILRRDPATFGSDDLREISERYELSIHVGATVKASDRSRAGSEITRHRNQVDVIIASGENTTIRHFLAGQERLDVLRIPALDAKDVRHTTVTTARDHGVFVEFDFSAVVRCSGGQRVRAIEGLQRLFRLVDHFGCPFVVSVDPQSHLHLRAPRELAGVAATVDLPEEAVEIGLTNWARIIERTRLARDDNLIEPGVERISDEADDR